MITPYFGQARRLRQELKREQLEDVKVGTVEEFQGQVRNAYSIAFDCEIDLLRWTRTWKCISDFCP